MTHIMEAASIIVLAVVVATLWLIANSIRSRNNDSAKARPPQPPSWPIIGHLPLLSRCKKPIHRILSSLSESYGPIMHLQLGSRPVLVIASSDLAKECLTTNDKAFASRPLLSAGKHLGYDFKLLGLAPYGSYWRNIRKICRLQLFTAYRIESFRHVRAEEISSLIRSLFKSWERGINPVTIKSRLSDLTGNIMMRIVASKRFSPDLSSEDFQEAQHFKKIIEESVLMVGAFDIGYYLPFLKWVDPHGIVSAMKNLQKKREVFMKKLLHDHREKRRAHGDLIDVLISATDNHEIQSDNNDDAVKATAFSMIIAGTETSSLTIEWALSALMQHPNILRKAHQELDTHVGRDRLMEESDVPKLKYLQAIVKETLRLYPAAPLLIPHESREACNVAYNSSGIICIWSMEDKMAQKRCRDPDDNASMQNKLICIKQSGFNSLSSSENVYSEKEYSNEGYCNLFDSDIREQTLALQEDCVSELMKHLKEEIEMSNEPDNYGESSVESNDVNSTSWEMGFQSTTHGMENTCMGMDSFALQTEFTDFILLKEMEFMGNEYNEMDNDTAALFSLEDCSYKLDMVSDNFYSEFLTGDELWQFDDEEQWSDIQREGADL